MKWGERGQRDYSVTSKALTLHLLVVFDTFLSVGTRNHYQNNWLFKLAHQRRTSHEVEEGTLQKATLKKIKPGAPDSLDNECEAHAEIKSDTIERQNYCNALHIHTTSMASFREVTAVVPSLSAGGKGVVSLGRFSLLTAICRCILLSSVVRGSQAWSCITFDNPKKQSGITQRAVRGTAV